MLLEDEYVHKDGGDEQNQKDGEHAVLQADDGDLLGLGHLEKG